MKSVQQRKASQSRETFIVDIECYAQHKSKKDRNEKQTEREREKNNHQSFSFWRFVCR